MLTLLAITVRVERVVSHSPFPFKLLCTYEIRPIISSYYQITNHKNRKSQNSLLLLTLTSEIKWYTIALLWGFTTVHYQSGRFDLRKGKNSSVTMWSCTWTAVNTERWCTKQESTINFVKCKPSSWIGWVSQKPPSRASEGQSAGGN